MLNKILSKKIKFPLSLRTFPPVIARKRSDRSNLSGFSLIELMVAVAILALAIFGIFHAYSTGFMGMADARDRTVATNYAREAMEDIKNMDFDSLEIIDETSFTIPAPTKFGRIVIVDDYDSIADLKTITTTVSWEDRNGDTKEVILETLIYNNNS